MMHCGEYAQSETAHSLSLNHSDCSGRITRLTVGHSIRALSQSIASDMQWIGVLGFWRSTGWLGVGDQAEASSSSLPKLVQALEMPFRANTRQRKV